MTQPARRNSLIVTIPLAVIALAWLFLVFLPIQKAIGRLQDEETQMQQYCDRSALMLPVLKGTGRDLADVRRQTAYWNETTPSRRDLPALLGQITASARTAGLRTTRFDPEPIVAYDRIARMPLSMAVTGSFPRLFTFLRNLETMTQTIWIERLEIEKTGQSRGYILCKLNLDVFMDNPEISDQRNDFDNR